MLYARGTRTSLGRSVRTAYRVGVITTERGTCGTPEAGTRTQYVQYTGAVGAGCPVPPVRTQRGRLVRVARTYPTEAPGRTCQLRHKTAVAATRHLLAGVRSGVCDGAVAAAALSLWPLWFDRLEPASGRSVLAGWATSIPAAERAAEALHRAVGIAAAERRLARALSRLCSSTGAAALRSRASSAVGRRLSWFSFERAVVVARSCFASFEAVAAGSSSSILAAAICEATAAIFTAGSSTGAGMSLCLPDPPERRGGYTHVFGGGGWSSSGHRARVREEEEEEVCERGCEGGW